MKLKAKNPFAWVGKTVKRGKAKLTAPKTQLDTIIGETDEYRVEVGGCDVYTFLNHGRSKAENCDVKIIKKNNSAQQSTTNRIIVEEEKEVANNNE